MMLLTTRHTKANLEQAQDISKKEANDGFEDVVKLE